MNIFAHLNELCPLEPNFCVSYCANFKYFIVETRTGSVVGMDCSYIRFDIISFILLYYYYYYYYYNIVRNEAQHYTVNSDIKISYISTTSIDVSIIINSVYSLFISCGYK